MNESKKHQKIVFFFTINGIGGVQNLFLNIIKELYKKNIEVKLIYYADSWLTRELDNNHIQYELFDLNSDKIERVSSFVNPDDILITTMFTAQLYYLYKINPYFLFWNVFPTTLIVDSKSRLVRIKKIFLKYVIFSMQKNNGLIFMDDIGAETIRQAYNINKTFDYLPIPIEIILEEVGNVDFKIKSSKKIIEISYIGRAQNWKVNPVKKLMEDLKIIEKKLNKTFCLHIITDNPEEFGILLECNVKNHVKIQYHTNLFGENLRKFLQDRILINFAMGMSCLESASIGLPSILLDACFTSYPVDYKYRWIFETKGYSLGEIVNENDRTMGKDLLKIFEEILSSDIYIKDISNKCFTYVRQNHNLNIVADDFLAYAKLCKNKLKPCLRNSLRYIKYRFGIL